MKKLTAILLTSALLLSITVSATTSGIIFTHNIEPGSLAIGKWGTQVVIENPDELKLEVESIEANRSSIDSFFGDVADSLEIEQPPSVPLCGCGKEERLRPPHPGYLDFGAIHVVLTHCATIQGTLADFPGIGATRVENVMTVNRRSFAVSIDQYSKENVSKVIEQLHQLEYVYWIGYFTDAHASGEEEGGYCGFCSFNFNQPYTHCCGECLWCGNCEWLWCEDCGGCEKQDCRGAVRGCRSCGYSWLDKHNFICSRCDAWCAPYCDYGWGFCGDCECCIYFGRNVDGCCEGCNEWCEWDFIEEKWVRVCCDR